MTFDIMRRHQRKIQIPLAVVVSIIFVFFFSGVAGIGSLLRAGHGPTGSLEEELLRTGHDLKSARLMQVPENLRDRVEADVKRHYAGELEGLGEQAREKKLEQLVLDGVRLWYRTAAAQQHYLPFKMAEELGVRIRDEELAEEVRGRARLWSGEQFDPKTYQDQLANWGLTPTRYEELLRQQMLADRAEELVLLSSGPSEAEMFACYCRDRQQVRVQYFQHRPGEFLKEIQVRPGARPEEKKPEEKKPAEKKAGEGQKPEEKKAEPEKKEEKEKKAVEKFIYEGDVEKRYKDFREGLEKAYRDKEEPGKEIDWPDYLPQRYPELFSEPRARVEYLLALGKDFLRQVKAATKERARKYYQDNPHLYREGPKPDQPTGTRPPVKPFAKVRDEIFKTLRERDAEDLAMAALKKAVEEHNKARPEKRKSLKDLARAHRGVRYGEAGPAGAKELREAEHLGLATLGSFFSKAEREKLAGEFTGPSPTKEEGVYVAVRLAEFKPVRMLELKEARAGLTYRLRYEQAGKLAKEAIEKEREALLDGKLDVSRVRQSALLGPGDETCEVVADYGLAVGEASSPYAYKQSLGPEAEAEQKKAEAEKEKKKKTRKPLEERIVEHYNRGFRVIVLTERKLPAIEKFRSDSKWRFRWQQRMPDWMRRRLTPSDDDLWRQTFVEGWRTGLLLELNTKGG